ncbi:MAG TPA: 3-oxoacyl-[acyl-carrier-protein] synthase III C-terminal domain-containing protein [Actinocrinis sp.]
MTALAAVSSYLPDKRVPIEEPAARLGLTEMQVRVFRKYHKQSEVRLDPGGSLADLLRGALAGLEGLRGHERQVRYVLHARTLPGIVPYPVHPIRDLCHEYGLGHAETLAVGQHACASGLLSIDIAGRLLAADGDPDALAVVLAGEKTFTAEAQLVPQTSFLGEGAGACLVRADGDRDRLLAYSVDLRGEFGGDGAQLNPEFQEEYAGCLAAVISAAVERAGARMDQIGVILPHSVNVIAWRRVCRRLAFPLADVVLDNVASCGHVFCADHFINYRTARARGLLQPGRRYVMAAAGGSGGGVFSAMVFQH